MTGEPGPYNDALGYMPLSEGSSEYDAANWRAIQDLKVKFETFQSELEGPDFKPFQRPLSPEPTATQIRIEALRAAAMMVAIEFPPHVGTTGMSPDLLSRCAISYAERFAAWLETGK